MFFLKKKKRFDVLKLMRNYAKNIVTLLKKH